MRKSVWMVACLVATVFFWVNFAAAAPPVVKLIATGGTIAMKIDPVKKAPVPAISGEDLLATVPDISKYATVEAENLAILSIPLTFFIAFEFHNIPKISL